MAAAVNLADEIVGGVLQHAELLRGAVVAADAGSVESLRWAGALPVLLRDLGVTRLVSTASVWLATDQGPEAIAALLRPAQAWQSDDERNGGDEDDQVAFVDNLVMLVSGFMWELEARLQRLLRSGIVRRLTVCSSLSERAHECFDFGDQRPPQKIVFDEVAALLAAHNRFQPRETAPSQRKPPTSPTEGPGDEWGWGEEGGFDDPVSVFEDQHTALSPHQCLLEGEVNVVHLPLNFAPLLYSKGPRANGEPSLFVLSHPICATAFPLLLTRVLRHHQHKLQRQPARHISGVSQTSEPPFPAYSHVKEVLPEHIPSEFRRTLKLVAHALGELLVQARLDAKERIYALGNTSLKIGYTLLKILNDLQEDLTTHGLQSHQAATIVLVDRTSDLASPCSFGVSLLDRVLALLPQSPDDDGGSKSSHTNRKGLHVTEIFPLHGSDPSPLSVALRLEPDQIEHYAPSPFVGAVKWKGGATLCHPRTSQGMNVFRSLAFRPAKLALRDLDKRLQEVEKELMMQRKITRSGSAKKPGEKPPSTRGRDVVMRRMSNILEAGEPTNIEHSALIELGIIVLETLERMERVQSRWDLCRERTTRHVHLRKQGGGEWIIPELADTVQRQFAAVKRAPESASSQAQHGVEFHELLTLLVHAYSLSSGSPVEDYTIQLIKNVVGECILETAENNPIALERLCPELLLDVLPFVQTHSVQGISSRAKTTSGEEDWDWDDTGSCRASPTHAAKADDDEYQRLQAKAVVEIHMERLLTPLKECAQLFAKQHDGEYRDGADVEGNGTPPRSLLAQICSSLIPSELSSHGSVAELEHIVDASEQLTRAGIDLLKSGFSRFGFGGTSNSSAPGSSSGTVMGDARILVIFVVGGVTFEEVQEIHTALEGNSGYQVIIGGTTITNSDIILEQLFK